MKSEGGKKKTFKLLRKKKEINKQTDKYKIEMKRRRRKGNWKEEYSNIAKKETSKEKNNQTKIFKN